MKTIILWLRNDLRVHDHPALLAAASDADQIIPLFILNENQLSGQKSGANRNRFLFESLQDLKQNLQSLSSDLVVRHGNAADVLLELAKETGADSVYYTADFTPYADKRDKRIKQTVEDEGMEFRGFPGRLIVSSLDALLTKTGTPYKVFTPFYKNWLQVRRRAIASLPQQLAKLPPSLEIGSLPKLSDYRPMGVLSSNVIHGGEKAGRERFDEFLKDGIQDYADTNNNLGISGTSRLSAYLHFGCLSPRELEEKLGPDNGSAAWRRQLAWREFYNYVLYHYPENAGQEFQERYRSIEWNQDEEALKLWQQGKTGYPIVDASMRQLQTEGWMHNRGRLIVGSFLSKDLWLDWRLGDQYFMEMLIDGDMANNNGNWQWIASVGVDPAPVFKRLYNPTSQQKNYDPEGRYVRRYVPELKNVPDKYLAEPWTMPESVQVESGCVIGKDYPEPMVDHKAARIAALDSYRAAAVQADSAAN